MAEAVMVVLGTGFGLGLSPVMPGTFGTLLGLPLAWQLEQFGHRPITQLVATVVLFVVGIPICRMAAKYFDSKDPGSVVFDEIAALPLVFVSVPFTWKTGILGFIVFRVFDIVKPWPIRRFERLGGGLGIMIDDLMAAVYSAAVLWLIHSWLMHSY